ncbi:sensor histidine kinase [Acidisarcina polymorpha]|nr:sensor histidine kinase [Acidisarcina polymorpha]
MNTFYRRIVLLLSVFLCFRSVAVAQMQPLGQMQHDTWAGHDGAPLGVRALALGHDGLLYLATFQGLFHFDGSSFEHVTVPGVVLGSSLLDLLSTQQGDMLLIFAHGAPILLHRRQGEYLGRVEGADLESIKYPQQSPDGTIWAVLNERLLVFLGPDLVWHVVADPGNGRAHVTQLFADTSGVLWTVEDDRVYRRSPEAAYQALDVFVYGPCKFTGGADGSLWIASSGPAPKDTAAQHLLHLDASGHVLPTPSVREPLSAPLVTRDGSLWLLTSGFELMHLPTPAFQSFPERPEEMVPLRTAVGLYTANALLQSSDGSIWVGGMGGLERFKTSTLIPLFPHATPGSWEFCPGKNGGQWIIDAHSNLLLRHSDGLIEKKETQVEDLDCSPFGNQLRKSTGLAMLEDDHVTMLPPPFPDKPGLGNHYIFTGSGRTADGSVLAVVAGAALGRYLLRYQHYRWQQLNPGWQGAELSGIYTARSGETYFGDRAGAVGVLDPGAARVRSLGSVGSNAILGFTETRLGLLAYGVSNIAVRTNGSFHQLRFADPNDATMVTGLVEADDGDLWLNCIKGVVRIRAEEFQQALSDPTHRLLTNNIAEGDYTGPTQMNLFSETVHKDANGRIWFDTPNGIVSLVSQDIRPFELPTVTIKDALVDGSPFPQNRSLAPGVNVFSVHYVGVDFSDPSGLSYAYRLDGYDNDWQLVGQRTEAVYTHLRAGRYTFSLKARNAFGNWTRPVSFDTFTVQPHYYERGWFIALVTLLLIALFTLAIRQRLRMAADRIRRNAEERADERITIARDLHDTLLQGIQGLLFSFHVAIEGVPDRHPSRRALERALTSAEKLIVEGRDRVKGLRGQAITGDELSRLLTNVAEDLGSGRLLHLDVIGDPMSNNNLRDSVAAELFLIAREAIVNAVRHAQASRITVRLRFAFSDFTLDCEDDGVGFTPPAAFSNNQTRWGLPGMQERVAKLPGTLEVRTAPGEGTLVRVTLKARDAYR